TSRRMQAYEERAPGLALAAATNAMADAGVGPGDVTHVVSISCTGFMAPGLDNALVAGLGLKPTVERTERGFMGCHGAINGLKVGRGSLALEPSACVVVCAVELCTIHLFTGWDPEKMVANALFSDGAAAAVCRNADADTPADAWRLAA